MEDLMENHLSYSDEDDDGVDNVEVSARMRKPYTVKPRPDILNNYNDDEFLQTFRFTKRTFHMILGLIEGKIFTRHNKNAVPSSLQLLLTLRYYATGMFYGDICDFAGIHKSTSCRIIKKVTDTIVSLLPTYIQFPTSIDAQKQTKAAFQEIARFPRVLGAVDCTHVRLHSPGGQCAATYRNGKGISSVNVQAICDSRMKFSDILARWPGSSDNSTIFYTSRIGCRFLDKHLRNVVLLGDNSYACSNIILTPLRQTRTRVEEVYNESHIRTQNVIEKTFDLWKSRFPALVFGLRMQPEYAQTAIIATAVLHNIAIDAAEPVPTTDANFVEAREELEIKENVQNVSCEDTSVRDALLSNYFLRFVR